MPDETLQKRFDELLASFLDETIDDDQLEEFVILIESSPEFTTDLRSQLRIDNLLCELKTESKSTENFQQRIIAVFEAEDDVDDFTDRILADWKKENPDTAGSGKLPWVIAITSAMMSIALLFLKFPDQQPSLDPPVKTAAVPTATKEIDKGVAVISGQVGAHRSGLHVGDTVEPGIFTIEDGFVEMEFYRGAQLSVAGPAKLELVDYQRVICHYGKIRTRVPEVAKGFTVVTPMSEVVDLGTEFAVDVDESGKTEVHVIDGLVEAYDKIAILCQKRISLPGKRSSSKETIRGAKYLLIRPGFPV